MTPKLTGEGGEEEEEAAAVLEPGQGSRGAMVPLW